MSGHNAYDAERYSRETDVYEDPTQQVETVQPARRRARTHRERDDVDYVVREDARVGYSRADDYEADAVREDVWVDRVTARRALLDRISSAIWFVTGLLEVAIGLRIAFLLLNANETSGFVNFIYGLTGPLIAPFSGIFDDPVFEGGAVLDSGALVAMVMYAFFAWAIVRLLWIILDYPETGVRRSVREVHRDRA